MLDPRCNLVLIRKNEQSPWQDRTCDIESITPGPQKIAVTFAPRAPGQQPSTWNYGRSRVTLCAPGYSVRVPPGHRVFVRGELWRGCDPEIVEFVNGTERWRRVFAAGNTSTARSYLYPAEDIEFFPDLTTSSSRAAEILGYFRGIVHAKDPDVDPIVRSFSALDFVHPDSALAAYLSAAPPTTREVPGPRIFPFRGNLSQQNAVEQALSHSISVIEGPPGTGKTETILNLIANIVAGGLGSVAVVSLSNTAVENVGDKLQRNRLGHIVAHLGNKAKQEAFFADQQNFRAQAVDFTRSAPAAPDPEEIADLDRRVRHLQGAEREKAETSTELAAYELEYEHFRRHCGGETAMDIERFGLVRRPSALILEFLAQVAVEFELDRRPGLFTRIRRYFRYGKTRDIDVSDVEVVLSLQDAYYCKRIEELRARVAELDRELEDADFIGLLEQRQKRSQDAFAASLAARFAGRKEITYSANTLRRSATFHHLVNEYPVVLSTCHSVLRNIPSGQLFDYVIIDEASQVDLLSASLALAVARNVVIVGDRKQLAPVIELPRGTTAAPAAQYDYGQQSLLSSVQKLYGNTVPMTLLREHYRCHPAIIGFCNRAFYDGKLIPFSQVQDPEEPAMRVRPTARGAHMRRHRDGGTSNQREIDVVLQEVLPFVPPDIAPEDIAFAAPFRCQVSKAQEQLNDRIDTVDTVHRLQGREKRLVVFTTVLSETAEGARSLAFVDDPRLINVAVSRAQEKFVVVTNFERLPRSRYVRDLIAYIDYQYPEQEITPSSVVSVFDLLYRDYEAQLAPLAARMDDAAPYRSEESIRVLLGDILTDPRHSHLRFAPQVLLRNLIPPGTELTRVQENFARRSSAVDFIVYNAVTRKPVLAIEVDGFAWHEDNPDQLRRDALKDSVLDRIGLHLLRLRTTESGEEKRIREAIAAAQR